MWPSWGWGGVGGIEKGEAEKFETHLPQHSVASGKNSSWGNPWSRWPRVFVTVLHPGKPLFLANGGDQCLSLGFHNNIQELMTHSPGAAKSKIKMPTNVVSGENASWLTGGCLLSVCSHGFSLLHSHGRVAARGVGVSGGGCTLVSLLIRAIILSWAHLTPNSNCLLKTPASDCHTEGKTSSPEFQGGGRDTI